MNPVFQREVRVQSRSARARWLRVVGAGMVVVGLGWLMWTEPRMFVGSGHGGFVALNTMAVVLLGIFTPMLTHDLLARERREGTLGLLCSTPLTPRELVFGKASSSVLQAGSLWLAMAPILMLPLLQGGVALGNVFLFLCLQLATAVCGLAAGLVSSAWNLRAGWALFAAYCILGVAGISVFVPALAVLAATPLAGASEPLLALLVLGLGGLVGWGFLTMAGQESAHAWNRIRLVGETADLMENLVPPTAPVAPVAEPRRDVLRLPDDGERRVEAKDAAPEAGAVEAAPVAARESTGLFERWFARRREARRQRDPWTWILSYRRDLFLTWGWLLPFGYFWWLEFLVTRRVPVWPEWILPILLTLRLPRLLREERRSRMLEVFATLPDLPGLGRGVCRLVWLEFGPVVGAHAGLSLLLMPFARDWSFPWGQLPLIAGLLAGPWVALRLVPVTRSYVLAVLLLTVGLHKFGWLVGWMVSAWGVGSSPSATPMVQSGVQAGVQALIGLWAWRSVRERLRRGGEIFGKEGL